MTTVNPSYSHFELSLLTGRYSVEWPLWPLGIITDYRSETQSISAGKMYLAIYGPLVIMVLV